MKEPEKITPELVKAHGLTEESDRDKPAVQIGDPFREKLLLEACLELLKTGAVVAMQDMGAAGLTSSSSEMASRGGSGIEIDISLVPKREAGWEIHPESIWREKKQFKELALRRSKQV